MIFWVSFPREYCESIVRGCFSFCLENIRGGVTVIRSRHRVILRQAGDGDGGGGGDGDGDGDGDGVVEMLLKLMEQAPCWRPKCHWTLLQEAWRW